MTVRCSLWRRLKLQYLICLMSTGDSTVALGEYDFSSDNCKWNFRDR